MEMNNLYEELDVDFEPVDRQVFLQELSDIAKDYKSNLGSEAPAEGELSPLDRFVEELGKEVAELSPKLSVVPLNKKIFADLGLVMPSYIANLMKRFKYFLVDFPITLVPRPGWGFERMECRVEFNPGLPNNDRPTAYQIFPQEEWQDVIHAWQELNIGLDENFEFKVVPSKPIDQLSDLTPEIKAAVEQKIAGKAGLVLGPFNYFVRKSKIRSQGRGNVKVIWRLDGEDRIIQTEPHLGIVLQVPKHVARIDAIGALAVYRTFHFFTAELHDVMDFLSEPTKNFLLKGAPATDKKPWDDITAGI
jgi:hypothetical protein